MRGGAIRRLSIATGCFPLDLCRVFEPTGWTALSNRGTRGAVALPTIEVRPFVGGGEIDEKHRGPPCVCVFFFFFFFFFGLSESWFFLFFKKKVGSVSFSCNTMSQKDSRSSSQPHESQSENHAEEGEISNYGE